MNPTNTRKASLFGKVSVLALCLSVATVTQAANTLNWTAAAVGGDLMESTNWDPQAVPASGDKLTVDAQKGVQFGTYTFPERMPASGALNTLNFLRGGGTAGVLDPGKDHALYAQYLNTRYSAIFSILSGRYFLTTSLGVGNSTSNSDTTYLTISGEDTFMQTPMIAVGTGSDSVGQSKAHVLVTDKATVDAVPSIGQNGGWKNSMTVSDEGTHLYSTNSSATVAIGSATVIVKKDGQPTGAICYSRENFLVISNKADFVATTVRVGADDLETKDNAFVLTDHATANVVNLSVSGTNVVRIADGSHLDVSALVSGYATRDSPRLSGSLIEVTNATVDVSTQVYVGPSYRPTKDNELRIAKGGVLTTPLLNAGVEGAESCGNVLRIEPDGEMLCGTFYLQGTNRVEVAGLLTVTNTVNVGRVVNATGGIGGSELKVCGGTFFMDRESTFYMGSYNKISNGNKVSVTDGGQLILTNANYLYVGAMGRDNELTVSGVGSRLVHYPVSSGRQTYVGVVGSVSGVKRPEYTSDNALTVEDGASFWTRSSLRVGEDVSNCTFTVDQATATVKETVEIGNGSTLATPTLMKIVGSNARLTATTLKVGAEGRIVFDLADAKSSAEALVQLTSKPTFKAGATIYITSSNPDVTKAEKFDVTLLSCAVDMDLSNVSIEIDPESGLRRWAASNPRVLCVRGGRPSGLMMIFR